jgi:hypothetical protein
VGIIKLDGKTSLADLEKQKKSEFTFDISVLRAIPDPKTVKVKKAKKKG